MLTDVIPTCRPYPPGREGCLVALRQRSTFRPTRFEDTRRVATRHSGIFITNHPGGVCALTTSPDAYLSYRTAQPLISAHSAG